MSNYPRVYGHCDAGCKRRVPSYEEFANSASLIPIEESEPDQWGTARYKLEKGKKYRVYSQTSSAESFVAKLYIYAVHPTAGEYKVSECNLEPRIEGDPYFTIMPISSSPSNQQLVSKCLYNDEGKTFTTSYEGGATSVPSEGYFYIIGATKVYLVNEDADIVLDTISNLHIHTMNVQVYSDNGTGGIDYSKPWFSYFHQYIRNSNESFTADEEGFLSLIDPYNKRRFPNLLSVAERGLLTLEDREDATYFVVSVAVQNNHLSVTYLKDFHVLSVAVFDIENVVISGTTETQKLI